MDSIRRLSVLNKNTDGCYPSVKRTNYVGEGGEMSSLPFVRGTSGAKATITLDQLMAYRPSLRFLFQVVLLSQPPFLFLPT